MAYIAWLTIFVWLPTVLLWLIHFKTLKKYKKTFSFCIFWALVFSIPWDLWATKTNTWNFPEGYNLGIWIGGLPLEEYLFIIFVTFLVSTLTLVLKEKFIKETK